MRPRHQLPTVWLMTDERSPESIAESLERLPPGAGIVLRHYSLGSAERRRLALRLRQAARRNRLFLSIARDEALARRIGAAAVHQPRGARRSQVPRTCAVHSLRELRQAQLSGAAALFVSPLFATRSHRGARPLGRWRAAAIVRWAGVPAYALGGMDARRFRALAGLGFAGWAAIDAWAPNSGVRT